MGAIYKCHSELPLSKLGLDRCKVKLFTLDPTGWHGIQFNTQQVEGIKRAPRAHGFCQNPPDPTNDPLPSLMAGVSLVLAIKKLRLV